MSYSRLISDRRVVFRCLQATSGGQGAFSVWTEIEVISDLWLGADGRFVRKNLRLQILCSP